MPPLVKMLSIVGLLVLFSLPVLEALLFKLAIETLILEPEISSRNFDFKSVSLLLIFGVIIYSARYLSKLGRVKFVNLVFEKVEEIYPDKKRKPQGWIRAIYLEYVAIIVAANQALAVILFAVHTNIYSGCLFFITSLGCLFILVNIANREYLTQKKLRYNKVIKTGKSSKQVFSRVSSSELTALMISFSLLLCLVALFFLAWIGEVSNVHFVILVFLTRFLNITYSATASSIMRLIRGYVYSEGQIRQLIKTF